MSTHTGDIISIRLSIYHNFASANFITSITRYIFLQKIWFSLGQAPRSKPPQLPNSDPEQHQQTSHFHKAESKNNSTII